MNTARCAWRSFDLLSGDGGDDRIFGDRVTTDSDPEGGDTLFGGSGNDIIYGSRGDDLIESGTGDDVIGVGDGIDFPGFDPVESDSIFGSVGDDTVFINGFRVNLEVHLGNGDDAYDSRFIHGRIHGTATIFGDNGDDVITLGGSGDQLYGGAGDDVLDGGNVMVDIKTRTRSAPASSEAADTLYGGLGDDTISLCEGHFGTGAAGADLFTADVFNPQPVSEGGAMWCGATTLW